jgi:hypothetical protein
MPARIVAAECSAARVAGNWPIVGHVRAPVRPLAGALPGEQLIPQRLRWADPRVILDPAVSADDFRAAMPAFNVGGTVKITAVGRHRVADELLLANVDLTGASIVDIGVSDGSTSVDLIRALPDFASYTMADLYLHISAVQSGRHTFFFDPDGVCVLVVGRRVLAWPSVSKPVSYMYHPLITRAAERPGEQILLLNPEARALISNDPRVTYKVHDVFTPWPGPAPDLIKVANLLRRLYFTDERIAVALRALLVSLDEGGHLLIVDNPRAKGGGTRAGLYRRTGSQFVAVARTQNLPEIDDLIRNTRLFSADEPEDQP